MKRRDPLRGFVRRRPLTTHVEHTVGITNHGRCEPRALVRCERPTEANVGDFPQLESHRERTFARDAHRVEQHDSGHQRTIREVPREDRRTVRQPPRRTEPRRSWIDVGLDHDVVQFVVEWCRHRRIVPRRTLAFTRGVAAAGAARSDATMPDVDPRILRVVPHRAPILRIERIVAADRERAIVAGSEPVGPGALPWSLGAIEGLAQSTAVMLACAVPETEWPDEPRGMLVAVRRFVVDAEPPAGASIAYHVRLVRRFGPTVMVSGHAEHAGRRLAAGDLTLWAPAQ